MEWSDFHSIIIYQIQIMEHYYISPFYYITSYSINPNIAFVIQPTSSILHPCNVTPEWPNGC
jgi:hypothetical protein